jgi:hypothetical protein
LNLGKFSFCPALPGLSFFAHVSSSFHVLIRQLNRLADATATNYAGVGRSCRTQVVHMEAPQRWGPPHSGEALAVVPTQHAPPLRSLALELGLRRQGCSHTHPCHIRHLPPHRPHSRRRGTKGLQWWRNGPQGYWWSSGRRVDRKSSDGDMVLTWLRESSSTRFVIQV